MPADPTAWRHETVQANGLKFHYVTAGEGPLLMLLHGFPQFWFGWRHQIPALAKKFRVVAPDQRGYGDTDKPKRVRDYRIETLADDVKALVHALGEKKAHICGHDWGGAVAWQLAAQHPGVVDRLAILNCPPASVLQKHLFLHPGQLKKSWYILFFQIPGAAEHYMLKNGAAIVKPLFRGTSAKKEVFTDEVLAELKANIQKPGAMTAMLNWYRAAGRRLPGRAPPKITAPTLVLWGEKDIALGKALTYDFPKVCAGPYRIEYFPDASHWIAEEQPERVNAQLLEHFA